MSDALDIDSDDDVPIVKDVEDAFGIKITDAEAAACETVGDLFRLICARVPTVERSDRLPCLTAFTFRELRRAIRVHMPEVEVQPKTLISSFTAGDAHSGWHVYLSSATGLNIAHPPLSRGSLAVSVSAFSVLALATSVNLGFSSTLWFAIIVEAAIVVALVGIYGPRSWQTQTTLGDLATETAARNVKMMIERHGAVRRQDVWNVLLALLRSYDRRSRWVRQPAISQETRFFANER